MPINEQLTSVKVNKELFDVFKLECVKRKFSLNKLVNRAMDLYLNDEDFRKQVTNYSNLKD
jgi:predicted HicB family RNase H-like nuclease